MREKFNHLYLDSHERKLLTHSLVELKNQLIQQGRRRNPREAQKYSSAAGRPEYPSCHA